METNLKNMLGCNVIFNTEVIENGQLIKVLVVLRLFLGKTQNDIAEHLRCTQSKVSKLENSPDTEITIQELMDYASAVGCNVQFMLIGKKDGRS
jgi:transcriptional regulator